MAWPTRARRSKFGAVPATVDGMRFASQKEARRFVELQRLVRAGAIRELECHPVFLLEVIGHNGECVTCGKYTADFQYRTTCGGRLVVEDVKSRATKTTSYRLRKRLVEALYGIVVTEV
jgi:hypothetical protein